MIQWHYKDECRCTLCNNVVWKLFFLVLIAALLQLTMVGMPPGKTSKGYVGVREKSKMVCLVA